MLTEGRVRAIAAQVASAIMSKIKPSVSDEQIRSYVETVIRQMQENGELTGSDLTDEQIAAVQENAEAAAGSATTASKAAAAAQAAQGKAETAQAAAESAKSTASQKATDATNAAQTATSKATEAAEANTAAQTAKGEAQTAATNAGKSETAAAGSATTASNAATAAQTAQGKAETAQAAAEAAKSTASQKATDATNAAQTAAGKATEASKSATAAGTAKTAAEAAAARAEEAANRLLGVAVVGVIETVNGAPSLVLTGVQEVADYTAYYKVVDEEGNETLVEIGQLAPKDETEPDPDPDPDPDPVTPTYTNILTSGAYTVNLNKRWSSSSKAATDCDGMIYLKIPIADVKNKTIYFKGFPANAKASNQAPLWFGLDSSNARIATLAGTDGGSGNLWTSTYLVDEGNGVYSIPINATTMAAVSTAGAYLLIDMATVNGSTAVTSLDGYIMTIGEPIA